MLAADDPLALILAGDAGWVLMAAVVALARIAPMVWLAPFLGGKLVPATIKTVLIVTIGVLLFPQLAPGAQKVAQSPPPLLVALLAKEVFIGLAIGFVVSLLFFAAQSAGRLVDIARGASLAGALLPQVGQRSSPLGSLSFQLAIVLFIALGGHRLFILAIGASYRTLPIAKMISAEGLAGFAALCGRLSADIFTLALSLAAPVVAALLLTDMALGLINRLAPQVNVFFLAMPLKALLGVAILALSLSLFLGALPPLMEQTLRQIDRLISFLVPR